LFVVLIILVKILPVKVAEDFAAMGKDRGCGGLAIEARRVLPPRVIVNKEPFLIAL
jgi:hypothetical protein